MALSQAVLSRSVLFQMPRFLDAEYCMYLILVEPSLRKTHSV
jgi:hypothetical protein